MFDNEVYIPTPAAGEDMCAGPGSYEKVWAFCHTAQTTPYQPPGELEEDGMGGGHSLWKKRDKHTEKNRVRTDVIWGLPEEREFPGSIGSKSVSVPSGQKGSHASPSFTRQLQSCPNIHTTNGTTFDLEVSHVSKVTETAEWQRLFELLPAPANQTENAGKLSFLYVRVNSSCRWDRI